MRRFVAMTSAAATLTAKPGSSSTTHTSVATERTIASTTSPGSYGASASVGERRMPSRVRRLL